MSRSDSKSPDPLAGPPGASGADLARSWFDSSPFARQLDLQLASLEPDRAEVRLPYAPAIATAGDVVHGGAISSLVDTAAALAAWSAHDPAQGARWGTVSMSISFESAARGQDLVARAEVTRRAKSICFVSVAVLDPDERPVAHSLITYRLG